jgi:hypothetical protein
VIHDSPPDQAGPRCPDREASASSPAARGVPGTRRPSPVPCNAEPKRPARRSTCAPSTTSSPVFLRDCRSCRKPDRACSIEDRSAALFLEDVLAAHGVVFCSPGYGYGLSPQTKAFPDRTSCYHAASQPDSARVIAAMSAMRVAASATAAGRCSATPAPPSPPRERSAARAGTRTPGSTRQEVDGSGGPGARVPDPTGRALLRPPRARTDEPRCTVPAGATAGARLPPRSRPFPIYALAGRESVPASGWAAPWSGPAR